MSQKLESSQKHTVCIIDPVGRKAGLDHYNDSLAANLNKLGTKTIVYSNYQSEYSVKKFPFNFSNSPLFLPGILYSFYSAFKKVKVDRPDFVILHLFKPSDLLIWFSRKLNSINVRLIFIVHDVESLISERDDESQMRELMTMAEHIVVHNQYSGDELTRKYEMTAGKVDIIPHGDYLDLPSDISKNEARNKLGLKTDAPIILFFGMIKPTKGLDVLLKAMQDVDAELIVAGRMRMNSVSDYSTWTDKLTAEGKLVADIRYISNERRDLYFKAADVIVLPYRKIYQSGVLIMALSYQLPVLASDLIPNKDFVKDFNAIEFFKCGDHSELSEKLNQLLSDPARLQFLKENGLALIKKNHNWELISKLFNKIICR